MNNELKHRTPLDVRQSSSPRSSVRWRIFGIIFLITVVNLADRISLSIAMPTIAKEFNLSPAMQGLILSSFFWSYALLQIPGGLMIDRVGPRKMIACATVLWGIFQTVLGAAASGMSMLLLRFGLGAAEAPLFPAGSKLNALWLSEGERARGAVLMDAGTPLGAAVGGLVISNLIVFFSSWRTAFVIAGCTTVACGWLAWRYLRDDPSEHPGVNASELAHIHGDTRDVVALLDRSVEARPSTLPLGSTIAMCIGRCSWAMIFFGLLTWGPSYLTHARGMNVSQIGASTFIIFLCGGLGSLTGGFLCDALCQKGLQRGTVLKLMLGLSGATTLTAFFVLPLIASPAVAVAILSVASFLLMWGSLYWSLPSLLSAPDRVGFVGACMNCAGSVGGIVVPLISGFILQRTASYDAVLYFYAICSVSYIGGSVFISLSKGR